MKCTDTCKWAVNVDMRKVYHAHSLVFPTDMKPSAGTSKPLREIVPDEETYRELEPQWSDMRMVSGDEPLPHTYAVFCEKMGWTNG